MMKNLSKLFKYEDIATIQVAISKLAASHWCRFQMMSLQSELTLSKRETQHLDWGAVFTLSATWVSRCRMMIVMMIIFFRLRPVMLGMESLLCVLAAKSESLTSSICVLWRRSGTPPVSSVLSVELNWRMKPRVLRERDKSTAEMITWGKSPADDINEYRFNDRLELFNDFWPRHRTCPCPPSNVWSSFLGSQFWWLSFINISTSIL